MSAASGVVGQLLIKSLVENCVRLHGLGNEREVETYFFTTFSRSLG